MVEYATEGFANALMIGHLYVCTVCSVYCNCTVYITYIVSQSDNFLNTMLDQKR